MSIPMIAVTAAIGLIIATMSVPPLINQLTVRAFGGVGDEPDVNMDSLPVIAEGSGWDESIVSMAMEDAAHFWRTWAKISINVLPPIRVTGFPTSLRVKDSTKKLSMRRWRRKA